MPESAVVIPVPEAEVVVAGWRARYDPEAVVANVPAHITLLYPFLEPDRLDADVEAALAALFGAESPFDLTLAGLCAFPDILYLAPEETAPFVRLTRLLSERFALLPYGGRFAEVVPHLTIGTNPGLADVAAVASEASEHWRAGHLPIKPAVIRAALMEQDERGRWSIRRWLPLGAAAG